MKTCLECSRFCAQGAGVVTDRGLETDYQYGFVGCLLGKWRLWDGDWNATGGFRDEGILPNTSDEFLACIGWASTCADFEAPLLRGVDAVIAELKRHYETTPRHLEEAGIGNAAGGLLHIATDDGNLEDGHVEFCLERCEAHGDWRGALIARSLLAMTEEERDEVYSRREEY